MRAAGFTFEDTNGIELEADSDPEIFAAAQSLITFVQWFTHVVNRRPRIARGGVGRRSHRVVGLATSCADIHIS
jgi:hypothetical protein